MWPIIAVGAFLLARKNKQQNPFNRHQIRVRHSVSSIGDVTTSQTFLSKEDVMDFVFKNPGTFQNDQISPSLYQAFMLYMFPGLSQTQQRELAVKYAKRVYHIWDQLAISDPDNIVFLSIFRAEQYLYSKSPIAKNEDMLSILADMDAMKESYQDAIWEVQQEPQNKVQWAGWSAAACSARIPVRNYANKSTDYLKNPLGLADALLFSDQAVSQEHGFGSREAIGIERNQMFDIWSQHPDVITSLEVRQAIADTVEATEKERTRLENIWANQRKSQQQFVWDHWLDVVMIAQGVGLAKAIVVGLGEVLVKDAAKSMVLEAMTAAEEEEVMAMVKAGAEKGLNEAAEKAANERMWAYAEEQAAARAAAAGKLPTMAGLASEIAVSLEESAVKTNVVNISPLMQATRTISMQLLDWKGESAAAEAALTQWAESEELAELLAKKGLKVVNLKTAQAIEHATQAEAVKAYEAAVQSLDF
jgi:hypothetical protein